MTITTGIYIISNVRRRNCIQLEDPNDRTPLKATPEQGTVDEKVLQLIVMPDFWFISSGSGTLLVNGMERTQYRILGTLHVQIREVVPGLVTMSRAAHTLNLLSSRKLV